MKKLIKNCRIISPDFEIENGCIEINKNIISSVYTGNSDDEENFAEIIDCKGYTVVPGFIDIHTHGVAGADTVDSTLEAIETIAKTKLKEGVTSFCPTTLTIPKEHLKKAAGAVAEYTLKQEYAKVVGLHAEGPFLSYECLGAQNPEFVRKPDINEIKALNEIVKVSKVTYAVETDSDFEFTKQLANSNIVASCGHSLASYSEFAKAKQHGLKQLTHFSNRMSPLHHREIGLVGAGFLDDDISLEIICDKIHLVEEMIQLIFKIKPIEKIILITDSMAASWLQDGKYNIGGLAVDVKDSAARLSSNGALAGSTLKYFIGLKNIFEITGLPLHQLIKTTSLNQANDFGLKNIGKIEEGFIADLALLDENFVPLKVLVDGTVKFSNL